MARNGAIYVGNDAEIEFQRTSGEARAILDRDEVNATDDRFSFEDADNVLVTGDRIRISRLDVDSSNSRKNLVLPASVTTASNTWEVFVYVDVLNRVYCYATLAESLTQRGASSLGLTQGNTADWERVGTGPFFQTVSFQVIEQGFRPFAKCLSYELTTARDTIDVTTLGEYFYKQYENGLISGQGSCTAVWDDAISMEGCGDPYVNTQGDELAAYFARLVLRIQIGAGFRGRFFLRRQDLTRNPTADRYAVFWQADCVCTNVAVEATPDAFLQTRIEFVTTKQFNLEIVDQQALTTLGTETAAGLAREGLIGDILTGSSPAPTVTVSLTVGSSWTATSIPNTSYYNDGATGNCNGGNRSPALNWSATGTNTAFIASYRITMIDTFTGGTFTHWTVTDIPANTVAIPENGPVPGTSGNNGYGTSGYGGPCPATGSGLHTYTIRLSARNGAGTELAFDEFTSAFTV